MALYKLALSDEKNPFKIRISGANHPASKKIYYILRTMLCAAGRNDRIINDDNKSYVGTMIQNASNSLHEIWHTINYLFDGFRP